MILYVNFEVSDFERSAIFYDAFLQEFEATRFVDREGKYIAWGRSINEAALSISPQVKDATEKIVYGSLVAFAVESTEEVDRLFAKGIELGATVASPVMQKSTGSYAGNLRDFDGHTIRLLCITA